MAEPNQESFSPDTRRTLIFAGAAAACLLVTGIVEWSGRPAKIEEFGKVGEQFYPKFDDPTVATALDVYMIDAEKGKSYDFSVERLPNGRWVIPSHHAYPADAEERLGKTAASIIGIKRGALVTRWPADHAEFGVVDPKQDKLSVGDVEGVGKRITLRGEDDSILADYIIGNQVDDQQGEYYVRHPDEEEVYIASLDIDISTKFNDWINTDLLEVDSFDITEVTLKDYSFDELQGTISDEEVTTLRRDASSDPWKLEGINEETEEVDEDAIRETVNTIGDLKIVGVRPKQQGLTPELKLDREALKSQRDLDRLQNDLLTRGFLIRPGAGGDQQNLELVAREGEIFSATNKGLRYQLYFGRAFTGSQEDLEIGLTSSADGGEETKEGDEAKSDSDDGGSKDTDSEDDKKSEDDQAAGAQPDSDSGEEEQSDSNKPGRYVFVRVQFDRQYLGAEPQKPTEPEMPAELKAAEAKEGQSEQAPSQQDQQEVKESAGKEADANAGDGQEADQPADTSAADETGQPTSETADDDQAADDESEAGQNGDDQQPGDTEGADTEKQDESGDEQPATDQSSEEQKEDPLEEMKRQHEEAKRKYEDDLRAYETELEEYNKKIEEGQKKAEELNRRFAEWYYVIYGESYDKLRLSRANLVKPKEEEEQDGDQAAGTSVPMIDPQSTPPPAPAANTESTGSGDADEPKKQEDTPPEKPEAKKADEVEKGKTP